MLDYILSFVFIKKFFQATLIYVNALPKMRPILSAIGTASYNLSKFLVPILICLVNGPYTIVNSFSFDKEVQRQDPTLVISSLDVDALFTSIPLDKTINILISQLFTERKLINSQCIEDIKIILELTCKDTLFLFNVVLCNQIDGVDMGFPLGPTFANFFMNFHEWLQDCPPEIKPKYYRRYVGDICLQLF